jgi:pyruvate dehydrogenase E2 component (dihydrolipoamide acetyltransferase)
MATEYKLPKLKEGVESVEVTELLASPGQAVEKGQAILAVNADKSTMEVPSPASGTLTKLTVKVGDELKVGSVFCVIEAAGSGSEAGQPRPAPQPPRPTPAPASAPPPAAKPPSRNAEPEVAARTAPSSGVVAASPATRWLARKLGVSLASVIGTGPRGRVTEDDVKNAQPGLSSPGQAGPAQAPPLPDFGQFGEVIREPLSRTRKLTARQMSLAWSLIPHVTQHDLADITDLEEFRKARDVKGGKLTVTAFVLKAAAAALRQFPAFNSSLDLANNQLILKKYVHIGVAVDTRGGLLVPVIRNVDQKGVEELAAELNETAEKARAGKADMSGGTFTITNLGGIGGTGFTPIVNWPEVAILGLSRGRMEPAWRNGAFVPRLMIPLSLSYDHRVIDGAAAARFTRRIAEMLENPWNILL